MKLAALIAAVAFCFAGAASAKVEIGGNATQDMKVKNGAVLNLSAGMGSKAEQKINNVEGKVKIGGDLTQKTSVENGAILNLAAGMGAKATQKINNIEGK
jgi:uncharacterized protein YjlB